MRLRRSPGRPPRISPLLGEVRSSPSALGRSPRGREPRSFPWLTSEPNRFFEEADVFLLPTRQDVWGMRSSKRWHRVCQWITTAVAGAATEVSRTGAGLVVENGSPTALADALMSFLEAPGRRKAMGEKGRKPGTVWRGRTRSSDASNLRRGCRGTCAGRAFVTAGGRRKFSAAGLLGSSPHEPTPRRRARNPLQSALVGLGVLVLSSSPGRQYSTLAGACWCCRRSGSRSSSASRPPVEARLWGSLCLVH